MQDLIKYLHLETYILSVTSVDINHLLSNSSRQAILLILFVLDLSLLTGVKLDAQNKAILILVYLVFDSFFQIIQ